MGSAGLGRDFVSCHPRERCLRRPQFKFAIWTRPNGKLELGATEAAFPGVTRYEVTAQAGRTHFFVARTSKRKNAMIAAAGATGGGILGLALSTALTSGYDNPGPIDFFPLDEAAARTTIAELRLAE